MVQWCRRPFGWIFISRMIGILGFLIGLVAINILKFYIASPVYLSGVTFLNTNFWLLILIAIIIIVGDLFMILPSPLNLPAPIIKAFGSVFFIASLIRCFQWLDGFAGTSFHSLFGWLSFIIVPLVFVTVLVCGYIEIFRILLRYPQDIDESRYGEIIHSAYLKAEQPGDEMEHAKSWEEIGAEFRIMLFDIIYRIRQEV